MNKQKQKLINVRLRAYIGTVYAHTIQLYKNYDIKMNKRKIHLRRECTNIYLKKHTYRSVHTYITYTHICMYTYIPTNTYVRTHTHTYAYINT